MEITTRVGERRVADASTRKRIVPSVNLPSILEAAPLGAVERVSASLEGDWSAHAVDIWRRGQGCLGFSRVVRSHPAHRPSLEIHLPEAWVGVPCFVRRNGENVFDEERARAILRLVESAADGDL